MTPTAYLARAASKRAGHATAEILSLRARLAELAEVDAADTMVGAWARRGIAIAGLRRAIWRAVAPR